MFPVISKASCGALVAGLLLAFASPAQATIANPLPGSYGPDVGIQQFQAVAPILTVTKEYDAIGGSVFGLFSPGAPLSIVQLLFGADPLGTQVSVDLAAGTVSNADTTIRSAFTPFGTNFGLFQFFPEFTVFLTTDPSFNPGTAIYSAVFPSLTIPDTYLVGFGFPIDGVDTPLGFLVVSGVASVPEPASVALLLAACVMALSARRIGRA